MKFKKQLIALFLYAVLTVILTFPQARHLAQGVFSTSDQLFYAWVLDRNFDSLQHQPLKEFFNANILYPHENTLAFSDHLLTETFLAAPFLWLTDNPVLAGNILLLFSFVFSGFGVYLWCRYHFKDDYAAFFAGTVFAFCNARFNQYDHLNILFIQWLPFIFLYLDKWLAERRRQHLVVLAFFFLLSLLSTVYYFVLTPFVILVYLVLKLLFRKGLTWNKPGLIKLLLPLVVTLVLTLALTTPTLLPYLKFKTTFPEVKRTLVDNVVYSATPASFLYTARTTLFARLTANDRLSESESGLFLGFLPPALLVYLLWKKRREAGLWLAGFFLFLSLSFGPFLKLATKTITSLPLPYLPLYYLFPPFSAMRVPARFVLLAELFLAFLAGLALVDFLKKWPRHRLLLTVVFVGIIALESWSVPLDLVLVEKKADFPAVYQWLKTQPAGRVVIELPIPRVQDGALYKMTKIRHDFLFEVSEKDYDTLEAYRDYFSTLHRQRLVNGYSSFEPPLYNETVADLEKFPDDRSWKRLTDLKVDYLIFHKKQYLQLEGELLLQKLLVDSRFNLEKQFNNDYVFTLKSQ